MIDIFRYRRLVKYALRLQEGIENLDGYTPYSSISRIGGRSTSSGPDKIGELLIRKQKLEEKYESVLKEMQIENKKITELLKNLDEYIDISVKDRYTLEAYFKYNLSLDELETSRKKSKAQLKVLINKVLVQLQDLNLISKVSIIDMQEIKVKNKIKE